MLPQGKMIANWLIQSSILVIDLITTIKTTIVSYIGGVWREEGKRLAIFTLVQYVTHQPVYSETFIWKIIVRTNNIQSNKGNCLYVFVSVGRVKGKQSNATTEVAEN